MKYIYKCLTCGEERGVEHSIEECDSRREYCHRRKEHSVELCAGDMYRVIQPALIIWPGGKPSET